MARLVASQLGRPRGAALDPSAIDALAVAPERWPADLGRRLTEALEASTRDVDRRALARAITAGGAERLGAHAKDSVRALRRQAGRARKEVTRTALLASAAELEGTPADGTAAAPSVPEEDPEICTRELERLAPLLRYVGAGSVPMPVTH